MLSCDIGHAIDKIKTRGYTQMYINKRQIKGRIKDMNDSVRINASYYAALNRKIGEMIAVSVRRLGSRKTITSAELLNGSDFGIKGGANK